MLVGKKKKVEDYGNIPEYIGFNPYFGLEAFCEWCGLKRYFFLNSVSYGQRDSLLELRQRQSVPKELGSCKNDCLTTLKVRRRLSGREAYHKNDIRFRSSNMSEANAVKK